MIEKATFKKGDLLQSCRFAPYEGDTVFIIDDYVLIFNDEIIDDFDIKYHKDIFEIIESVE